MSKAQEVFDAEIADVQAAIKVLYEEAGRARALANLLAHLIIDRESGDLDGATWDDGVKPLVRAIREGRS